MTIDENILLKPVKDPSPDEFYSLIEQAQKTVAQLGLTEKDINAEIKAMRADKRKREIRINPSYYRYSYQSRSR